MADVEEPTDEVGSEGGANGDVDVGVDAEHARGSEGTSTVNRVERRERTVAHDVTGIGRRSPTGADEP